MTKAEAEKKASSLIFEEQFFGQWAEEAVEVCHNDTTDDEELSQNDSSEVRTPS